MEIQVPANAFDWIENCHDCRRPMAKVLLTTERIKILPNSIVGGEPFPSWFYDWSQTECFIAGASVLRPGDNSPIAFPTWYCPGCITVWVVYRGLWFKTSFAPAVPGGIVNAGDNRNVGPGLAPAFSAT
jgi:hypothetical protein